MGGGPAVVVVGCGVIGLSTALRLAESGRRVRIVARERTPRTTSDVAGAVWLPFRVSPPERALEWSRRTFEELSRLARLRGTGVRVIEGMEIFASPAVEEPWWRPAAGRFRRARPGDLPAGFRDGWVFEAPVVAMSVYLSWLEGRFAALGGVIEEREVTRLEELSDEAPIVVNCTGLGSRALLGDEDLHPVRGQIVRVEPGRVDRFVGSDEAPGGLAYVIPRPDCTVLGGTEDEDSWEMAADPATSAAILDRCTALAPALAGAKILSAAVGLRPARSAVRLETETPPGGGLQVHNYGHGGAGVTLSWGCAEEVVRIVDQETPCRNENRPSPRSRTR